MASAGSGAHPYTEIASGYLRWPEFTPSLSRCNDPPTFPNHRSPILTPAGFTPYRTTMRGLAQDSSG